MFIVAVPIGGITDLARSSVYSAPYRLLTRKEKKRNKTQIGVKIPSKVEITVRVGLV